MSEEHWLEEFFRKLASKTSTAMGSPWAFLVAFAIVIAWALSGSLFHYGTTWQLVINTGTTIVTFLMVFLIQNSQNRDTRAMLLKMDELIRANDKARNELIGIENAPRAEIDQASEDVEINRQTSP